MTSKQKNLFRSALGACAVLVSFNVFAAGNPLFIVRNTAKSPQAVTTAIERYAHQKKWLFLGASKVKNGQVTLVKFCVPSVGKEIWSAGMYLSAMLPCGQVGIYKEKGKTEVSLLDPGYMSVLDPNPKLKKAGDTLRPMFMGMLDNVLK